MLLAARRRIALALNMGTQTTVSSFFSRVEKRAASKTEGSIAKRAREAEDASAMPGRADGPGGLDSGAPTEGVATVADEARERAEANRIAAKRKLLLKKREVATLDNFDELLDPSWERGIGDELKQKYFQSLKEFLVAEDRRGVKVFPPPGDILNAFRLCPLDRVKVVILGQDPYHNDNQAHGLAFSVPRGVRPPPSLVNIYKELADSPLSIPFQKPAHGNLEKWCDQGVLLLNATLTVRAHQAASHQKRGWEQFTDKVIEFLNREKKGLVFLLWGKPAQAKGKHINRQRHFSRANELLRAEGKDEIDWRL